MQANAASSAVNLPARPSLLSELTTFACPCLWLSALQGRRVAGVVVGVVPRERVVHECGRTAGALVPDGFARRACQSVGRQ
eukprot:238418-Chlamydomonas_euryale.AAC.1